MDTQPRRSSFGMLLRRTKSGDLGKGGRKAQALREAELERQRQADAFRMPPKLPEFANNSEQLSKSFGPDLQPDSAYTYNNVPPTARSAQGLVDFTGRQHRSQMEQPRVLASSGGISMPPLPNGGFDPYARTESMTHRGRYSYASTAVSTINSPRRVRRRKDPTPFK